MNTTERPTLAELVAAEIRAEMARQQVTQTELARRLGWRQDAVSRRLSGRSRISIAELEAIAGGLGRRPLDFIPQEDK